jgi:hypothetical protein
MGNLMDNEHTSTPPYALYRDNYRTQFEYDWDTRIDQPLAPTRRP